MTHRKALMGTTALVLTVATSSAAHADVTGADVWNNWKDLSASYGQTITASETQNGGTLSVSNVTIAMEVDDVSVSSTIPSMEFIENGDGTVSITMPPSYDIVISFDDYGETIDIPLQATTADLYMLASGDPGAINYEFSAASMGFAISDMNADDANVNALISMLDVSGTYDISGGADAPNLVSVFNAAKMILDADVKEIGGPGYLNMDVSIADISMDSAGHPGMFTEIENLSAMFAQGFTSEAGYTYGPMSVEVAFEAERDSFHMSASATGGDAGVIVSSDAVGYGAGTTNLNVVASGSEIPLPEIAFDIGEIGFDFVMPGAPSDVAKEFGVAVGVIDATVSDMIWGMIDPGKQLPRDPVTALVDISGMGKLAVDIFSPEALFTGDMPGEVESISLNELIVSVAGAELFGNGAFTIDMSNWSTFGAPAPTGTAEFSLKGANALIDKLIAMGLLPQEQAMMARMGMGMFAKPGDGPDSLVSKIEVDGASGKVLANGVQLR